MFARPQLWMTIVASVFAGVAAYPQALDTPVSIATTAKPADVAGDWQGTLNAGMPLRIIFHIKSAEDGLHATLDSPDQGVFGMAITSAQLENGVVKLTSEKLNGGFEGTLSSDLTTLNGAWRQGAKSVPLVLRRVKDAAELERHPRPQEPKRPYPYREEDVVYDNKAGGNRLGATLTLPSGKGPFPAVILISGTGRHDRDETVFDHKPFLVLADHLTRKGIAVLRVDSRGAGKSTGDFAAATDVDFASDAEAGIVYLKGRPEVDPRRLGLIGHSEGGFVTSIVGARNPAVSFVVMMAGPGVRGDELIVAQVERLDEVAGKSHEAALKDGNLEREILTLVEQTPDNASLKKSLHEKLAGILPENRIDGEATQMGSPWYRYFIAYDPAPALKKMKCPVLALIGDKDVQVPADQNLPAIRKALEAGGNKNFEVDELPGLNHLFQTAKTGSLDEYGTIEETMSPVALEKVSSWILKLNVRAGAN